MHVPLFQDLVAYYAGPIDPDLQAIGFTTQGWYFVDETFSFIHGPHTTEADARAAMQTYADAL